MAYDTQQQGSSVSGAVVRRTNATTGQHLVAIICDGAWRRMVVVGQRYGLRLERRSVGSAEGDSGASMALQPDASTSGPNVPFLSY